MVTSRKVGYMDLGELSSLMEVFMMGCLKMVKEVVKEECNT